MTNQNEDYLQHWGVKGMRWGVWNEETRRKYMGGSGRKASSASDADAAKPNRANAPEPTVVDKLRDKVRVKVEDRRAAREEENRRIAEENRKAAEEQSAKEKADAEIQDKYGITREQYDAIRKATLNSSDPRVVAQGMKYLTDEELNAKITRLETEMKINDISAKQRQSEADTRKKELEARQQTIPYRLGKMIVDSARDQIVKPVMGEVGTQVSNSIKGAVEKGVESLKKQMDSKETKEGVKNLADDIEKVKDEAANVKLQVDAGKEQTKKIIEDTKKRIDESQGKTASDKPKESRPTGSEVFAKKQVDRAKTAAAAKRGKSSTNRYNNSTIEKGRQTVSVIHKKKDKDDEKNKNTIKDIA